jgi:hypothetical protein
VAAGAICENAGAMAESATATRKTDNILGVFMIDLQCAREVLRN